MATTHTVKIGGSDSGVVGQIALGLMMLTWTRDPVPKEQAFEAIKTAIDSLPRGVKMFLNSGEFYANDLGPGNLELLADFFASYPGYADKVFLSVKGGAQDHSLNADSSPENLRRSVDAINAALAGHKKLDLFEPARLDPKYTVEEIVETLAGLVKEGKFDYIGLSEVSAATVRKAHAVHPIAAVEIEVSPWSYEEETKKVIAATGELGIALVAYSPLGRGFLTGQIKSRADIPEGDIRHMFERFSDENIANNLKMVEALKAKADEKGITVAQLCLAWIGALGPHLIPIPGSSKKSRVLENLAAGMVDLSSDDLAAINDIVEKYEVAGHRYFSTSKDSQSKEDKDKSLHLWS